ncbi:MAG TPA: dihydropteroate synthase [Chitinophagaceae bacterium]|nr:dihydropteroate synthase [Chitinophagaceae bacterium]
MFSLNCKGKLLVIDKPLVMGIINVTPDSFYAGSRQQADASVLALATKMNNDGADIIDVGGQSTRPGSKRISVKEELQRVLPAIETILKHFPKTIISVDTYQSEVAKEAIKSGAAIINDISAGNMDNNMIHAVAKLEVPYICMHMKGTPKDMQENASYENITKEVLDFFIQKTAECKQAGINDIVIDPGFGFGKGIADNFTLLKALSIFTMLEKPIMAGLSRKSTIYKTLNTTAENALNGTTVLNTLALQNGANILRVHDVKEAKEAVKLYEFYSQA